MSKLDEMLARLGWARVITTKRFEEAGCKMKSIRMVTDYYYQPVPRVTWRFVAGVTYKRVLEMAAQEIVAAGAGAIVVCLSDDAGATDETHHRCLA